MKNLFGRKIKNLSSIVGIILMLLSFSALVSGECTCSCMITNCETGACQSRLRGIAQRTVFGASLNVVQKTCGGHVPQSIRSIAKEKA